MAQLTVEGKVLRRGKVCARLDDKLILRTSLWDCLSASPYTFIAGLKTTFTQRPTSDNEFEVAIIGVARQSERQTDAALVILRAGNEVIRQNLYGPF